MTPEISILLVSLIGLAVLATEPLWPDPRLHPQLGKVLFAALLLVALVAGHWSALRVNRPLGNPDEAQMIAGALTLSHDPVFWRSVDGTTHGPYAQWPLVVARLFQAPFNFIAARAVAILCTAGTLLLLAGTVSFIHGPFVARMAVLPAAALLAATREPEFWLYNSEHAALLLLAGACYAANGAKKNPTVSRAFIVGVLIGAVPFAKLQALPLAAGVGLWWLAGVMRSSLLTREQRLGLASTALGGTVVSWLLAVGPAWFAGEGPAFWTSYIIGNLTYAANDGWILNSPRLVWGLNWLLLVTGAAMIASLIPRTKPSWHQSFIWLGWVLGAVGLLTILLPGRPFRHYWLLIMPASVLLCATGIAVWRETPGWRNRLLFELALTLVLILPFASKALTQSFPRAAEVFTEPYPVQAAAAIRALSASTDSLAVWGWAPELYVLAQRRQATREAHTYAQLHRSQQRDSMRQRFMADLDRSRPAVFADAVGPRGFFFTDVNIYGHESFKPLAAWIQSHYSLVGEYDGMRIYRLHRE